MVYKYDDINPDDYIKSKSQVKREMTALQKLGEQLIDMNDKQLATIPTEDKLLDAILEARKCRTVRYHAAAICNLLAKSCAKPITKKFKRRLIRFKRAVINT